MIRKTLRPLAAIVGAGVLASTTLAALGAPATAESGPVASASSFGMKPATKIQAKKILKDLNINEKRKCFRVIVSQSSGKWAFAGWRFPPPKNCMPGDGIAVAHLTGGKWKALPIASNATCREVKKELRANGASNKVVRDFTNGDPFDC